MGIPTFEDLEARDVKDLEELVAKCTSDIEELNKDVAKENQKRAKWTKENNLRKHDMVPLALCALRHLARKGEFMPAFEKGKVAHLKRVEEKKAQEAAKGGK